MICWVFECKVSMNVLLTLFVLYHNRVSGCISFWDWNGILVWWCPHQA